MVPVPAARLAELVVIAEFTVYTGVSAVYVSPDGATSLTVMFRTLSALPWAFEARIVTPVDPCDMMGVPVIAPVEEFNERPAGREPD